ncbi:MAG TPA: DUF6391 domain-containing protein [Ktedonobacterales bacterium]
MELGDLLLSRRVRQNHALEHATVTILANDLPGLSVSARSNTRGFTIFADLDPALVRRAADEAMERLRNGEADLAIHPNCGTNLAVGMSLALMGSLWSLTAMRQRTRLVKALGSTIASFMVARPLGGLAQKYLTTHPNLVDVRIVDVRSRRLFGQRVVETLTATAR